MTVLITLSIAGTDSGPFDLYSNLDGYISAFESGVPKASLLAGYPSSLVPDFTTTIRVRSNNGLCTNYIEIPVEEPTTTTTSSSSTSSSTTTTTSTTSTPTTTTTTTVILPLGSSLGFPGPDTCTSLTVTSSFTDGGGTLTQRGICYNTTGNPTIADSIFIGPTVTGVSTINVTGLTPNTNYYWRAYAINEIGVGYYQTVLANPTGLNFPTDVCPSTTTTSSTTPL
jgi:hypothetical protein